jgi:hypothetical protein
MRGGDKLFSASAFSNANGGGKVVNAAQTRAALKK